MHLNLFDDNVIQFYPLTMTRSVGDLRCGIMKLRQRLSNMIDAEAESIVLAPDLQSLYLERHPDWLFQPPSTTVLHVNTRIKVNIDVIKQIKGLEVEHALVRGDDVIALHSTQFETGVPTIVQIRNNPLIKIIECEHVLYGNISDLIHDNKRLLEFDFNLIFNDKDNYFETEPGVTVLHPYNVWLGESVLLKPGVVIDASEGAVAIDDGATIMPNAVIIGPAYIGKNSIVRVGAKIYPGSSIGPVCKVGGEIEDTIIHGYSNKQHDGFLGHSYIGEWVNIGADTNNSDLKNNYHSAKFYSYSSGCLIDSQQQFLGTILGDHTKIGINCSINTGCVIGIGCNLYGSKLISGHVPSFSWGQAGDYQIYRFEDFIRTAEIVKSRRKLALTTAEKDLFLDLHSKEKK